MFFKPDVKADLHDIAKWVGKEHVRDLTIEDIKRVVPESRWAGDSGWESDDSCPFVLVHKDSPYEKATLKQRLNRFWVIPLYLIVIGPLSYVVRGSWHTSENSKVGKVLKCLIGE